MVFNSLNYIRFFEKQLSYWDDNMTSENSHILASIYVYVYKTSSRSYKNLKKITLTSCNKCKSWWSIRPSFALVLPCMPHYSDNKADVTLWSRFLGPAYTFWVNMLTFYTATVIFSCCLDFVSLWVELSVDAKQISSVMTDNSGLACCIVSYRVVLYCTVS